MFIYVNGDLVPRPEAKISVFDSGFLIGDGVWEGVRLHDGVIVFWEEHLDLYDQVIHLTVQSAK